MILVRSSEAERREWEERVERAEESIGESSKGGRGAVGAAVLLVEALVEALVLQVLTPHPPPAISKVL